MGSNKISENLLNKFEENWELIQEGGETNYPKVKSLVKQANKKTDGDELPQKELKKIHKALQLEVFGKVLPSKLFAW